MFVFLPALTDQRDAVHEQGCDRLSIHRLKEVNNALIGHGKVAEGNFPEERYHRRVITSHNI